VRLACLTYPPQSSKQRLISRASFSALLYQPDVCLHSFQPDTDLRMRVSRIADWNQPPALAQQWNELARGVPFRTWDWMSTWWRHYGSPTAGVAARRELFVLGVYDAAGALAGLA